MPEDKGGSVAPVLTAAAAVLGAVAAIITALHSGHEADKQPVNTPGPTTMPVTPTPSTQSLPSSKVRLVPVAPARKKPQADAPQQLIADAHQGARDTAPQQLSASAPQPKQTTDQTRKPTGPVRVAPGVVAGSILDQQAPVYPAIARAAGLNGSVVLQATISKTGTVEKVRAVSGPAMLTGAAIDAVKQWKYKPYLINGEPTEVDTTITVNFNLNAPDSY